MRSAIAALVLVLAAALAPRLARAAVEVFVKTPTKLHDSNGKPIKDVSAGYPFQAERGQGDWVYGFLPSKGGGLKGFIRQDALALSDDHRRALNIPITTGKSAEPVLLRYRLKPNERQVYELSTAVAGPLESKAGGKTERASLDLRTRLRFSLLGKSESKDTAAADVSLHGLLFNLVLAEGGSGVAFQGNETGISIYDDEGDLETSARWGDEKYRELRDESEVPDLAPHVRLAKQVAISSRHEIRSSSGGLSLSNPAWLGTAFSGVTDLVYPKERVKGGDSWKGTFAKHVAIPTPRLDIVLPGGEVTYTVLERTDAGGRPCVKLLIQISARQDDATADMRAAFSATGIAYIDEATGILLSANLAGVEKIAFASGGADVTGTLNVAVSFRYAGDKVK